MTVGDRQTDRTAAPRRNDFDSDGGGEISFCQPGREVELLRPQGKHAVSQTARLVRSAGDLPRISATWLGGEEEHGRFIDQSVI